MSAYPGPGPRDVHFLITVAHMGERVLHILEQQGARRNNHHCAHMSVTQGNTVGESLVTSDRCVILTAESRGLQAGQHTNLHTFEDFKTEGRLSPRPFSRFEPRRLARCTQQASSDSTDSQHELLGTEVHPGRGAGPYTAG